MESIAYAPKKALIAIKGISEAKADKLLVSNTTRRNTTRRNIHEQFGKPIRFSITDRVFKIGTNGIHNGNFIPSEAM